MAGRGTDTAAPDADFDAGTDGDGDVCSRQAVWSDVSKSFTMTQSGGSPGPIDAGCRTQRAPDVTVMVRDCADRIEGSFNSNFYAGCPGQVVTPPYLDFDDIFSLQNLFGGMIASSCDDQDAGDGGTCRPLCRQVFW